MKNAYVSTLGTVVALAVLFGATPAAEAGHITEFTGMASNDWNDNDNWDDDKPSPHSRAYIPAGKTVFIDFSTAICESLDLAGTLTIEDGGKLQITNDEARDSDITGDLDIEKGGDLFIENTHTITGDNGRITGLATGGATTAKITGTDVNTILTIEGLSAGAAPADSLTVRGPLDIEVKLDNDAHVSANSGTLTLKTHPKLGDGVWKAESTGTLDVAVAVTGTSDWELSNNSLATILFSVANTALDGDILIRRGTLDIDADVDICGILTFQSISGSKPRIEVANGVSVMFGQ